MTGPVLDSLDREPRGWFAESTIPRIELVDAKQREGRA